jgi:predicted RNA polymerase sigma factor
MKNRVEEVAECAVVERLSAVDKLKAKKVKLLRDLTNQSAAIRTKYDRAIRLAEDSDAEQIMREVYDLLDD